MLKTKKIALYMMIFLFIMIFFDSCAFINPFSDDNSGNFLIEMPTPTPVPTSSPSPVPISEMVAWYKFDETSGTIAYDSSPNGKNANLYSGCTWGTGYINNGCHLNGTSTGYIEMPAGILSSLTSFTICTWVYLYSNAVQTRIFDFGTGTSYYMFMSSNAGTEYYKYAITKDSYNEERKLLSTTNSSLPTNIWIHVAVAYDSGNLTGKLYLNGVLVGTNTSMDLNPSSLGSTTQNWIGKSQYYAATKPDPYTSGIFDDFRIYKIALSDALINQIYTKVF